MDNIKVYIVTDSDVISSLINDKFDEFKAYISPKDGVKIFDSMEFDTEAEAMAFCAGLGYCEDEHSFPNIYPLRSCEPCDLRYIETIESLA